MLNKMSQLHNAAEHIRQLTLCPCSHCDVRYHYERLQNRKEKDDELHVRMYVRMYVCTWICIFSVLKTAYEHHK